MRETAVAELARLRLRADRALVAAIDEALHRAIDDDSRRVSAAAQAVLHGEGVMEHTRSQQRALSELQAAPRRFVGFLADSDRTGYRRMYLDEGLHRYIDFRSADVIDINDIPPDESPIIGTKATAVTLRPEALVYVTTISPEPGGGAP